MSGLRKFLDAVRFKNNSLFSLNKKQATPRIYAPGTQIGYDAGLVVKLKKDHEQLVEVYTDIVSTIRLRDYEKLRTLIEVFLALFNAHALAEYTKLYVFLDYAFRSDQQTHDVIMRFRREMNEIGKAVRKFAYFWRDNGIRNATLDEFKNQVEQIGGVLTKRIEVEESQLYEIYRQAQSRFVPSNQAGH